MTEVTYLRSKISPIIGFIFFTLIIASIILFCLSAEDRFTMLIAITVSGCFIFFILYCWLLCLKATLSKREIKLSSEGIAEYNLQKRFWIVELPWAEIESITKFVVRGNLCIGFKLSESFRSKLYNTSDTLSKKLGRGDIWIPLSHYPDEDKVYSLINVYYNDFKLSKRKL